jgi:hypothetical protein
VQSERGGLGAGRFPRDPINYREGKIVCERLLACIKNQGGAGECELTQALYQLYSIFQCNLGEPNGSFTA